MERIPPASESPEQYIDDPTQSPRFSRRALLAALASAGVAVVGGKLYHDHEKETVTSDRESRDHLEYDERSNSGFFRQEVERFQPEFERDADVMVTRRELLELVQTNFKLEGIDNEQVRANLERLVLGIGGVESRFNKDIQSSEAGAFSFLQLMPEVWKEHAKDDESPDDPQAVIAVAVRLMEQTYQHITTTCKAELALIRDRFFGGDQEAFDNEFLTPLLVNAYNAGMGSMATLVKWFAKNFKGPEDTVELFEQSEVLTGYDVFMAVAQGSRQENVVTWYKTHASDYTPKVYAAFRALEAALEQQG